MDTNLQRKLLNKYPQFFSHLENKKIYIGERPMIEEVNELLNQNDIVEPLQFGIETGNGWFMLLSELMAEIDNHLKNVNRWRKSGKHKYKFLEKLSYNLRIRSSHNQKTRKKLGEWVEKKAPKVYLPPISINIDQIKEKFSTLRFYYSGGDEEISGMVSLAESLSACICENCGSTINIGCTTIGWQVTMCESCATKSNCYDRWKKNSED